MKSVCNHKSFFLNCRQQIEAVFDDVRVVDVLDSKDQTHLALMSRPELGVTFTKLHCWTFTKYEKCVFLDADTLVSAENLALVCYNYSEYIIETNGIKALSGNKKVVKQLNA